MQNSVTTQTAEAVLNTPAEGPKVRAKSSAPKAVKPAGVTPLRKKAGASGPKKVAAPAKAKPAAKQATTKVAAPSPKSATPKVNKAPQPKPQKIKLVRDSFTFPESEHKRLVELKKRVIALGVEVKKGELVRAALEMLASLDSQKLLRAIATVEKLKTGRPKK